MLEYNVYGVFFLGVFGIIIGFNKNMVWGVINVGYDVFDWYWIDWVNFEKIVYWIDGEEKFVWEVVEVIQVKGCDEFLWDIVCYIVWGLVIYDDLEYFNYDMVMCWLAYDELVEKFFYVFGVFMCLMGGQGLLDY